MENTFFFFKSYTGTIFMKIKAIVILIIIQKHKHRLLEHYPQKLQLTNEYKSSSRYIKPRYKQYSFEGKIKEHMIRNTN